MKIHKKSFRTTYYIVCCFLLAIFSCQTASWGQGFDVFKNWNFENAELDNYSSTDAKQDFDVNGLWHTDKSFIVYDTINAQPTKVLRTKVPKDLLWEGFQMYAQFDIRKELYMSYNIKFDKDWNSTAGGKLSGLRGFPRWGDGCPETGDGFYLAPMFKRAGSMISYHYDRTPAVNRIGDPNWPNTRYCPWAVEEYYNDSIFCNNGNWYNITQRLVTNSFTDGVPNPDGINEIWVDGRMIFRESELILVEDSTNGIDGLFLGTYCGGSSDSYKPVRDSYMYLDNITLYMPDNDSVIGQTTHHPSTILPTPDQITDKEANYDEMITTESTLSNSEYGTNYSPCIDETYLIDAGEGNTVTFNITSGSLEDGDYLIFYDGNTTDAPFIDLQIGSEANVAKARRSSGRYMFVRFSTDREKATTGWSGTVSFDNGTSGLIEKKKNGISIFPNPGTNTIIIEGIKGTANLNVYNILGKKILSKKSISNSVEMDISNFQKGVYTVIISKNPKENTLKFIKK